MAQEALTGCLPDFLYCPGSQTGIFSCGVFLFLTEFRGQVGRRRPVAWNDKHANIVLAG